VELGLGDLNYNFNGFLKIGTEMGIQLPLSWSEMGISPTLGWDD